MARTGTLGTTATTVYTEDGWTVVRYHQTDVVRFREGGPIILNTDGYRTTTTKLRMNQASRQFCLGYRVYQDNFMWFVNFEGKCHVFEEDTLVLGDSKMPTQFGRRERTKRDG